MTTPINVHVLTGFLGSGKTTLLNRMLREERLSNTAVVVNEFGAIGVDHLLVEQSDDQLVTLAGGCVCCTVRGDLAVTLAELLMRRDDNLCLPFERIVIETTGLADPAPIANLLTTDPVLAERLTLGCVVATVDAAVAADERADPLLHHIEAQRQVAFADHLVVTKADLSPLSAQLLRERLASRNPNASITNAIQGDVPNIDALFSASPYDAESVPRAIDAAQLGGPVSHSGHGPSESMIDSFVLYRDEPLHAATLPLFVTALAEQLGPRLLRVKGFVAIEKMLERPAVLQGVQHVFHPLDFLDEWPGDDRRTRLVFIVQDVSPTWVRCLLDGLDWEARAISRELETARLANSELK
ncbi:MAG: GTP-binding protein [Gammaproteobacteria bacterium]|nr:GTP-binding protein [Gammaproteobacteria bacterium]